MKHNNIKYVKTLLAGLLISSATSAGALVISENFDAPTSGISYVGDAFQTGSTGILTDNSTGQSGAIWNTTAASFDSFTTEFDFIIGPSTGGGADGFTFSVIDAGTYNPNTALGGAGGGLGYLGLSNSFAVEFDTWNNGAIDGDNANHVGINQNGSTDSLALQNLPFSLETDDYSNWHTAKIAMDTNGSLTVSIDSVLYLSHTLSGYSNNVYFGFTGATGAAVDQHIIDNWSLTTASVPEPSIFALMGLGLIGVVLSRKRKQA